MQAWRRKQASKQASEDGNRCLSRPLSYLTHWWPHALNWPTVFELVVGSLRDVSLQRLRTFGSKLSSFHLNAAKGGEESSAPLFAEPKAGDQLGLRGLLQPGPALRLDDLRRAMAPSAPPLRSGRCRCASSMIPYLGDSALRPSRAGLRTSNLAERLQCRHCQATVTVFGHRVQRLAGEV